MSTAINDTEKKQVHDSAPIQVDQKALYIGTHRVCLPEETLSRVQPLFPEMGITRVADITQLDDLGIPVFQAIRPNSRNLSTSQGKGITKLLAKVSAVMESIETWHAEQPSLPETYAAVGDMATLLPYSIYDLNLAEHHLIHDRLRLTWFPGTLLGSEEKTFVPASYVRLDFTTSNAWVTPTFDLASNGLASGNTLDEAILHGLYEVIERDTFARVKLGTLQEIVIDPETIDGIASKQLIDQLHQSGADFEIKYAVGSMGVPCFSAHILSPNYPVVLPGYGCHLDRDVALSRAITEAAQARLTMISGARDDIGKQVYSRIQSRRPFAPLKKGSTKTDFRDIPSVSLSHLKEDLHEVTQRFLSRVACLPVIVNLTKPEFNIPVVFVVAPQLRFLETRK